MPDERSRVEELLDAVRMDLAEFRATTRGIEGQIGTMSGDLRRLAEKVERQAVLESKINQVEKDLMRIQGKFWQLLLPIILGVIGALVTSVMK